MSDSTPTSPHDSLEKLTNAPFLLEGRTFSKFSLKSIGMIQRQAKTEHQLTAAETASRATGPESRVLPAVARQILATADAAVSSGRFNFGNADFTSFAFDITNLPFLAWVGLQQHDPSTTLEKVTALITPDKEKEIQEEVLKCLGYTLVSTGAGGDGTKNPTRKTVSPNPSTTTGPQSSNSSESAPVVDSLTLAKSPT